MNSLHKGQWSGALMFSLICVWINGSVCNRESGDLRRHRGHYDVIVMRRQGTSNHGFDTWSRNIPGAQHDVSTAIFRASLPISPRMASRNRKSVKIPTSTVYWCIASKLKAPRNFYWMSNMFLWVDIFLFFVCYHVVPKRHSQLDYELNDL